MATYSICPNEGLPEVHQSILGLRSGGWADWQLILWTNEDFDPDQNTVFDSLTEAEFGGYSRITITKADWTDPVVMADKSVSTWKEVPSTWTVTSDPETIQGWAIVTPTDSVIIMIQKLDAPIPTVIGGVLGILPYWEYTTEVLD